MQFIVTQEEQQKISEWLDNVVYPPIIEQQLKDPRIAQMLFPDENGKIKYPYLGAIGGGLTYEFTPTSLGTCFKVRFGTPGNEQELDLTDYDSW